MSESDPLAWLTTIEGVPSAFAAARDGIDVLLRDRGLRRTTAEQTTESLLRGAHASAVLEGSTSSLDEVRAGEGDALALASVRLSAQLLGLAPTLETSPLQAIARIHAVVAKGEVPEVDLGRPVSDEASQRLATLARTLGETKMPALMVAAIAHADLATVAPFVSHNGIVARAVERLLLASRAIDPFSVVVPEVGHLQVRAQYESNLRAYRTGGRPGLSAWLNYAAEAYTLGADASPLND